MRPGTITGTLLYTNSARKKICLPNYFVTLLMFPGRDITNGRIADLRPERN